MDALSSILHIGKLLGGTLCLLLQSRSMRRKTVSLKGQASLQYGPEGVQRCEAPTFRA